VQRQYEIQYHKTETRHWWFVGRRRVVYDLATRAIANSGCRILEIGCSSGQFMLQLRQQGYENVVGIDISEPAVRLCQESGLPATVMDAQRLDFPDGSFDLITASDVLEHLRDENEALQEWRRVLKPGGRLVVFVPAFMFLWSKHDVANNHYRRYRLHELEQALVENGFVVERGSYWNFSLFLPIAVVRSVKRLFRPKESAEDGGTGDLFVPPAALNRALLAVLRLENWFFIKGANWPFGVSAMAVGRRPAENPHG
jgi:SAM-dependent methyltransferase